MLPVIVSQLVVLLKDTALGYIVAYPELLPARRQRAVGANYGNVVPAAIVVAVIYIIINSLLTAVRRLAGAAHPPQRGIRVPPRRRRGHGRPGRRRGRSAPMPGRRRRSRPSGAERLSGRSR